MDSVGAVGADDDRLLDVGGPGRAGDEEYRARRLADLARRSAKDSSIVSTTRGARTTQTCVSGSSAVTFGVDGEESSSVVPVSAMAQKHPVSPVLSSPVAGRSSKATPAPAQSRPANSRQPATRRSSPSEPR